MKNALQRNKYSKKNTRLVLISSVFILFIIVGAFINKIYANQIHTVLEDINGLMAYYNDKSKINLIDIIYLNIGEYIRYLGLMGIFTLFFVTFPLAIIVFISKAMSIGYTINSCFLLLKFKSYKICMLILFKNIIIIPFSIILLAISIEYIKNIHKELKKNNKEGILFLVKTFLLNLIIVIFVSVLAQSILNLIIITILQFLAR